MGLSTGILVSRMKRIAQEIEIPCKISACSISRTDDAWDADCVLLGPQVAYQAKTIRKRWPEKPVFIIDQKDFSAMDAKKLEYALDHI